MLTQIEQTGQVNLSDLKIETHNKQAINTTEAYCKAAGVRVVFSGNDTEIDFSNFSNDAEE